MLPDSDPVDFRPVGMWYLPGRGPAFHGPCPFAIPRKGGLNGRMIRVYGRCWRVVGTDVHPMGSPFISPGETIGVLVRLVE